MQQFTINGEGGENKNQRQRWKYIQNKITIWGGYK